jgi:NADH-quinone oxidoreductase subunit G
MPKVTIDNRVFDYDPERPSLLQFCLDQGIELPHFCYHPAMTAPANCRQCLVEVGNPEKDRETGEIKKDPDGNPVIRFMPKLMTSCSQNMSDGLVVKTHRTSDLVRRAQKDNLEFLLINHPLDCPICDQAGHCPLQNQAYKYGPEGSRFEFRKVSKPKHIELGPRVVLDGERCINCTRCTRFTHEISESYQLTIIERGVRNYPMTPPGTVFDEPYSMNVIDICPVGALTSKDWRFQSRVWEMSSTPSITTANAKGSNCFYWVKDNLIMKVTPRTNMDVNEYWLPDEDRLDYARFNENRPNGPTVNGSQASWEDATARAAELLEHVEGSEMLFIGSAHACVEDNYMLVRLARGLGADTPLFVPHVEPGHGDDWLRTDDRTPNSRGCELLDMKAWDSETIVPRLRSGAVKVLVVLGEDPVSDGLCSNEDLEGVDIIALHFNDTNAAAARAAVTLPAATVVETVGTFVNIDGHAQKVRPAKAIRGVNRTLAMAIGKSRADRHGTPFDRWYHEGNLVDCRPGWVSIPVLAGALGLDLQYTGPKQIMHEITEEFSPFAGATYEAMGDLGVRLSEIAEEV